MHLILGILSKMASSLDMLCDMLDEEISDEEEADNPQAVEPEKEKASIFIPDC